MRYKFMEDDFLFWEIGRRPPFFGKLEDDLNFSENLWQPQFLEYLILLYFLEKEDNLIFFNCKKT